MYTARYAEAGQERRAHRQWKLCVHIELTTLQHCYPSAGSCLVCCCHCCTATHTNSCCFAAAALFHSRSYEGATAAAASDSIMVNQGGKRGRRGTVIANSMLTGSTSALPAASRRGSFGTTAQPVGSMALSGNPNGRIQIAQVRRVWLRAGVAAAFCGRVAAKESCSGCIQTGDQTKME